MHPKLQFKIEQIAIAPKDAERARTLLEGLGLTEWFKDNVVASGNVYGIPGTNSALLQFNYQAGNGSDEAASKPLELEILKYVDGRNWVQYHEDNIVSHLGMHVSAEQLEEFRAFFFREGYTVAQEVWTQAHTNPHIAGKRFYNYVIFNTRSVLGVDLKFIVRKDVIEQRGVPNVEDETPAVKQPKAIKRGEKIVSTRIRRKGYAV